jgi:hypothetical protein
MYSPSNSPSKGDSNVPASEGDQMFLAAKKVKKPVWLLDYGTGNHALAGFEKMYDFTIKQQQFFDHYLKDTTLPDWMK